MPNSALSLHARRWAVVALRTIIAVGLLVILASLAVRAYPPLYVVGVGLLTRNSLCTTREILRGADQYSRQHRAQVRFAAQMRLKTEDPAGYRLWLTPAGDFWFPKDSDDVLPVILAQQEVDLYGLAGHGVRPGDVVLDCGAHVGLYTRTALRAGARLVVAIEPAPANLECLRRNLAKEIAAGQVMVLPKGVWDKQETLPLYENPANTSGDSFVLQGYGMKVVAQLPLTTIDTLAAELKLPPVTFIKMDIKGAVAKALNGARRTLRASHARLAISTEEAAERPENVTRAVDALGLGYRRACGSCALESGAVSTEVLFFF